jgi:hypothetical protein
MLEKGASYPGLEIIVKLLWLEVAGWGFWSTLLAIANPEDQPSGAQSYVQELVVA